MPRRLTYLGLIGGPLVVASAIATLFGAYTQTSSPEFLWELSIGIWLVAKGFNPSPILSEDARPVPQTS